jgi:hypothetical protein
MIAARPEPDCGWYFMARMLAGGITGGWYRAAKKMAGNLPAICVLIDLFCDYFGRTTVSMA